MNRWLARSATLVLLTFQLVMLTGGALVSAKPACCCEARGKVCHCKSHHQAKSDDGRPCLSACATGAEVPFSAVAYLALPERLEQVVRVPTWTLGWAEPTAGPSRVVAPEAPPPRA